MTRKTSSYRWSRGHRARLKVVADRLEKDHTAVLELALQHFYGTTIREQPVYVTDPVPVVQLDDEEDDDASETD
jgi:hypothetical protein